VVDQNGMLNGLEPVCLGKKVPRRATPGKACRCASTININGPVFFKELQVSIFGGPPILPSKHESDHLYFLFFYFFSPLSDLAMRVLRDQHGAAAGGPCAPGRHVMSQ
jgi:hypothetical protein